VSHDHGVRYGSCYPHLSSLGANNSGSKFRTEKWHLESVYILLCLLVILVVQGTIKVVSFQLSSFNCLVVNFHTVCVEENVACLEHMFAAF